MTYAIVVALQNDIANYRALRRSKEPEPQAWHRHIGFTECGALVGINDGGIGEIFFRKVLTPDRSAPLIATAWPNEC
jgi:hypothetical protein